MEKLYRILHRAPMLRSGVRTQAVALAPALFILGSVSGLPRPAPAAPASAVSAFALDTRENRQLASDLSSTFNTSLARVYIDQGPEAAYSLAREPWRNPAVLAKLASVPDCQLPIAVITLAQCPDLAKQYIDLMRDMNRNTWGNETPDQARHEAADTIYAQATDLGTLLLLGGKLLKQDGIVNVNPDSLWETEAIPELRYFYNRKHAGESNYDTIVRLHNLGEQAMGPRSLKIVDALIAQRRSPVAVGSLASMPAPGQ